MAECQPQCLLLANVGGTDAEVDVVDLLDSQKTNLRRHIVPASSRATIPVADEAPELAAAAFGIEMNVRSGSPVVAERSMWWPGPDISG